MTRARWTAVLLGCVAAFAEEPAGAPTFSGEVGRILTAKCIGCHRTGELGRFPLDTWEQARLFTREIRLAVGMRTMPPWPAVPDYGHFSNDRSLSVAEIETLIRWTDSGALKGSGDGRLIPPYERGGSDEPGLDLAPALPYEVPASGAVETRCFSYPGFSADTWIRGIDVVPGDRRVVRHVRVFADPGGIAQRLDLADPAPGFRCSSDQSGYLERPRLGDWTPAMPLQLTPPGVGRELNSGTRLLVEIRYGRIGTRVSDATHIRLLTLREPPERVLQTRFIPSPELTIPADTWSYRASTTWTAPEDMKLHAIVPYLSDRGTDFKAHLTLPGGTGDPLVWIHDYDVDWQIAYQFVRPLAVPSGSRIAINVEFDNFETNPRARKGEPAKGRYGLALEYEQRRNVSGQTLSSSP